MAPSTQPEYALETVTAEVIPGVKTVVAQKGQLVDAIFRPHVPDSAVTTTAPASTPVDYGPVNAHNLEVAQRDDAVEPTVETEETEEVETETDAGSSGDASSAAATPATQKTRPTRPAKARPAAANKARTRAEAKAKADGK